MSTYSQERNLCAGMVAGAIGGVVATWAMSEFQGVWSRVVDGFRSPSAAGHHDARDWQERHEGRNANEVAAQVVSRDLSGQTLIEHARSAAVLP